MKKKKEKVEKITLAGWLIELINTPDWRIGKVTGWKHPIIQQETIDRIGKRELLEQAEELEKAGILKRDWEIYKSDIRKLNVSVDSMDELCKREGIENPKKIFLRKRNEVEQWREAAPQDWRTKYYDSLLKQMNKGVIPEILSEKENLKVKYQILFQILNAIPDGNTLIWKRVFSVKVTGQSKLFEKIYQKRVVTILKNYAPIPDKEMEEDEILAEFGILTYSQSLEWKGALCCQIENERESICYEINTENWDYGYVMNAQSLEHAVPICAAGVKKVITIENKANYESMVYQPEILCIYCHGFFSPKERRFLKKLYERLGKDVEYYHWSDMDYGGIRIFQFVKERIFPELKPLHMNCGEYKLAVASGKGIPLTEEKRKKLKKLDAGELDELKKAILENKMEIEQEVLLKDRRLLEIF